MLHLAQARKIIETHEPIDISFWKKNGDIVEATNVVCTSSNFKNNTFNFKWLDSEQFRKVKALHLFNLNGEEIFV